MKVSEHWHKLKNMASSVCANGRLPAYLYQQISDDDWFQLNKDLSIVFRFTNDMLYFREK